MFLILLLVFSIISCYKFGEWENYKKYNATILFFIAGDLLHKCLTVEKPLWHYEHPSLNDFIVNLLIMFIAYPSTVLIFIPKMLKLKSACSKLRYITKWVIIYSVIEVIAIYIGFFKTTNGWNIWYSVVFNFAMFALLWLHYNKPLWAYLAIILQSIIILLYFNIPISEIWSNV